MDQMPRRSLRSAEAALKSAQEAAAATGNEEAPATIPPDSARGRKKRAAAVLAKSAGDCLTSKTRLKSEESPNLDVGGHTLVARRPLPRLQKPATRLTTA